MRRLAPYNASRCLAPIVWVGMVAGVACSPTAALADEAGAPKIDKTTLTSLTEAGATIEAQINPQGSETFYEIKLVWQEAHPPARGEAVTGGSHAQGGRIVAGFGDRTVSATLTGMQRGYTYWYEVVARNAHGKTKSGAYPFGYLNGGAYPEGTGSGPPYVSELSQEAIESGNLAAKRTLEQAEAERRLARELEERQANEAAARRAAEAAALEQREQEEASAQAPACVVPALKGKTLDAARRALKRSHCRLGKVGHPSRNRGALVVVAQARRHGETLANGTYVAVALGPKWSSS